MTKSDSPVVSNPPTPSPSHCRDTREDLPLYIVCRCGAPLSLETGDTDRTIGAIQYALRMRARLHGFEVGLVGGPNWNRHWL